MTETRKEEFIKQYELLCLQFGMRITTSIDAPYTEGKARVMFFKNEAEAYRETTYQTKQLRKTPLDIF
jgi:hypothetical protein